MKFPLPFPPRLLRFGLLVALLPAASLHVDSQTTPAYDSAAEDPDAAPQVQRYSLTDYVNTVMERSPAIVSGELNVQSLDYARRAAQAAYFPKLMAQGSTGYIKGAPISPFLAPGERRGDRADGLVDIGGGSLDIPIFTDGTFLGINAPPKANIALAQKNAADADVLLTKSEIRFRAITIYLQAIAASKEAGILEPKLEARENEMRTLQIKAQHHLVAPDEIQAVQAQLAEVSALAQRSQWLTASALLQVAQLVGATDPRLVQIESNYPDLCQIPDYQSVLTSTLMSHPSLGVQQAVVDQTLAQHSLAQSALLPSVALHNSYEYGDDYRPPGNDRWLSLLSVSLPIFDGGENYYKVRSSEKEIESAKQKLYQVKLDIESDLQNAYSAIQDANAAYATSLVAYDKTYLQVERDEVKAKMGQVPVADYLEAQVAYSDAAYQAEANHFQLLVAYASLEKTTAGAWSWPLVTK